MVLLMATFFWAMWDEDFGQRPWKTFQHQWKDRYSTFLKNAGSQSSDSQNEVVNSADYQKLNQDCEAASQAAPLSIKEINEKLHDLSAKILAVQNLFTDRRAYVGATTYGIETETSPSAKQSKQRSLDEYKKESITVDMPDGKPQIFKNYDDLEKTYNDLKNERTQLSAELGALIKPVREKNTYMSSYLSNHMVNLTPSQLVNLLNGVEAWTPKIRQINVNEHSANLEREDTANIVDRCESCHMGIREPVKL